MVGNEESLDPVLSNQRGRANPSSQATPAPAGPDAGSSYDCTVTIVIVTSLLVPGIDVVVVMVVAVAELPRRATCALTVLQSNVTSRSWNYAATGLSVCLRFLHAGPAGVPIQHASGAPVLVPASGANRHRHRVALNGGASGLVIKRRRIKLTHHVATLQQLIGRNLIFHLRTR